MAAYDGTIFNEYGVPLAEIIKNVDEHPKQGKLLKNMNHEVARRQDTEAILKVAKKIIRHMSCENAGVIEGAGTGTTGRVGYEDYHLIHQNITAKR